MLIGTIGTLITWAIVAAAVSGAIVGTFRFFSNFVMEVMNSTMRKLKEFMNKVLRAGKKVFAGVKTFVKKIQKGVNTKGVNTVVQEIVKEYTYQRDKQRWIVTETTREVPPDKVKEEIPADILKKVGIMTEYDVTDRVKMKLEKCA